MRLSRGAEPRPSCWSCCGDGARRPKGGRRARSRLTASAGHRPRVGSIRGKIAILKFRCRWPVEALFFRCRGAQIPPSFQLSSGTQNISARYRNALIRSHLPALTGTDRHSAPHRFWRIFRAGRGKPARRAAASHARPVLVLQPVDPGKGAGKGRLAVRRAVSLRGASCRRPRGLSSAPRPCCARSARNRSWRRGPARWGRGRGRRDRR